MRFYHLLAAYAALRSCGVAAASSNDDAPKPAPKPCTISSTKHNFFDLTQISLKLSDPDKTPVKGEKTHDWSAKGYDYPADFSINVCNPVLANLGHVEDIAPADVKHVGAFYEMDNKTYSIGKNNSELVFRGKKLVLNYTDGSACPGPGDRRKNTVISFLCERDTVAQKGATFSFVATPDNCSYFFEARSFAACPSVNVPEQSLGPSSVFGIILGVAILVYLIGGIVYQRSVMHQRGWRQLPNYGLWAGAVGFLHDMVVILTSSCTRCLPGRKRGYNQLSTSANGYGGRGRGASSGHDDENRLIDELDEEY